jgi:hypothetical protein
MTKPAIFDAFDNKIREAAAERCSLPHPRESRPVATGGAVRYRDGPLPKAEATMIVTRRWVGI